MRFLSLSLSLSLSVLCLCALACGKDDPAQDTGTADTGFASCGEADKEGFSGQEGAEYCELASLIMDSGHDEHTRHAVLECLPDLSTAERTSLLSQWQEITSSALSDEVWALAQSECETSDISELR